MKLKELLLSCQFEDIAEVISTFFSVPKGRLIHFKSAYDILCRMEYTPNNRQIEFFIPESCDEKDISNVDCYEEDEDSWSMELGKDIVITEGLEIPLPIMAAHCLWNLTFYGFSEEQREESCKKMFGQQEKTHWINEANRIKLKRYENYLTKELKLEMRQAIQLAKRIVVPSDVFWYLQKREICRNRSKRKRDYRHSLRIKHYERMNRIELLIKRLLTGQDMSNKLNRKDLEYLFNTALIGEYDFRSYATNKEERITYFDDLLQYQESDTFDGFDKYLIAVVYSPEHPLTDIEREELKKILSIHLPFPFTWAFYQNDNLDYDVELLIMCSKNKDSH